MIQVLGHRITHILFDLDETLYSKESGLMAALSQRINEYMQFRLGIEPEKIKPLRQNYYQTYGTTSRGLDLNFGINLEDYHQYVHDIPVNSYLKPDPALDQLLTRLLVEKSIFSNSPAQHIQRVLQALGIERHFAPILDIYALERIYKPDLRAYKRASQLLGTEGEECLLVDDQARNLPPGKELGMTTVLIGENSPLPPGVDFTIPGVHHLETVLDR